MANPKSTTGRLDIFTRLITEHGDQFDRVPKGYRGLLYAEVSSRTFPVRVRAGMSLNQLRFVRGAWRMPSIQSVTEISENWRRKKPSSTMLTMYRQQTALVTVYNLPSI